MTWSRALISLAVLVFACIYAAPSFYDRQSAIQINASDASMRFALARAKAATGVLESHGIENVGMIEPESGDSLTLTFPNSNTQQEALKLLRAELGESFALTLKTTSSAPSWFGKIGAHPINLGLDLQGGVLFLLRVDMDAAVEGTLEGLIQSIRRPIQSDGINLLRSNIAQNPPRVVLSFENEAEQSKGYDWLVERYGVFNYAFVQNEQTLELLLSDLYLAQIRQNALEQNLLALRGRVNELGIAEPSIQQQGDEHILIQLPGVQDPAEAKRIIGATATLNFRLQADAGSTDVLTFNMREGGTVQLERQIIASGENVTDAQSGINPQGGGAEVNISLDGLGGQSMAQTTQQNIGRAMAVVFSETHLKTFYSYDLEGNLVSQERPVTTSEVISLATIQGAFSDRFRITGVGTIQDATDLSLLLRAGALVAPVYFVQEQIIGPSLGEQNIKSGVIAAIIGFAMVLIFALIVYRGFGLASSLGLLLNLTLLVAIMSTIGATLTLSGIAGIVLNIGLSIDANVLNFSRIKEEIYSGKPLGDSIQSGFRSSFSAIFDSNLTTIMVALAIYSIATGSVKGFAVTLAVGVISSMFTALIFTRLLVELFARFSGQSKNTGAPSYLL